MYIQRLRGLRVLVVGSRRGLRILGGGEGVVREVKGTGEASEGTGLGVVAMLRSSGSDSEAAVKQTKESFDYCVCILS